MNDLPARKASLVLLLLVAAFTFRLWFGLCSDFWTDDEKQVYLIGLKFYATRAWPYFGPDVTNTIQVPGALQGLTTGLPFFVYPAPESPYVLLNLISFAALCFFAWYCAKRLPNVPRWIIWAWLLTAPWTLSLSTHVFNPSYVLAGGILFFTAALELYPQTTRRIISPRAANFMMGFGLFWVMQFHLSWASLVPFALAALFFQYRAGGRNFLTSLTWFALGASLPAAFLVPTYLKYGLAGGLGDTPAVVVFNTNNLKRHLNPVEGILGRFLSFASFELPRFIGGNNAKRLAFLREHIWLTPFVIFLTLVGLLQPLAMIVLFFKKRDTQADWRAVKHLTLIALVLLYVSFLFSFRPPYSHMYYVFFPLAMLYSLYCWSDYLARRGWQIFAAAVLASGVIFHAGLALHRRTHVSMYTNRSIPQAAIEQRDYRLLGERREGSRY